MMNQISLRPSFVARSLGLVALALVVASTAGKLAVHLTSNPYVRSAASMFDVDLEGNFPTAFSALLLLFAALLLAIITLLERKRASSEVLYWATLSIGFFFMAFDESFRFHEKLNLVMKSFLDFDHYGILYFSWVVPGIGLVVVLGLVFARFLAKLPAQTRVSFLIAATLYLGGAIGIELVGGRLMELHGHNYLSYKVAATTEEGLEMVGAIVFIWALIVYMAANYRDVSFRFEESVGEFRD
jgi:hypothetical protein